LVGGHLQRVEGFETSKAVGSDFADLIVAEVAAKEEWTAASRCERTRVVGNSSGELISLMNGIPGINPGIHSAKGSKANT
jgi:hypothetical protein